VLADNFVFQNPAQRKFVERWHQFQKPNNMTRFFSLTVVSTLTVLIFSCVTSPDSGDCGQFKNGKFIFHLRGQNPGEDIYFSINRQDSIQMESDKKSGNYTKLRLHWTDKCKYETLVLESTYPFSDSVQNSRKTIPMKTEIIAWTKDYYVFSSHRGNSPTMTDTMWVEK
jgi:hypothetical protein